MKPEATAIGDPQDGRWKISLMFDGRGFCILKFRSSTLQQTTRQWRHWWFPTTSCFGVTNHSEAPSLWLVRQDVATINSGSQPSCDVTYWQWSVASPSEMGWLASKVSRYLSILCLWSHLSTAVCWDIDWQLGCWTPQQHGTELTSKCEQHHVVSWWRKLNTDLCWLQLIQWVCWCVPGSQRTEVHGTSDARSPPHSRLRCIHVHRDWRSHTDWGRVAGQRWVNVDWWGKAWRFILLMHVHT